MTRFFSLPLVLAFGLILACEAPKAAATTGSPAAAATADRVVKPFKKSDGSTFKIAVIQSGEYFAYNNVLISIHDGLADLGWTGKVTLDDKTAALIPPILAAWKTQGEAGASAVFPPELFFDLNWTEDQDLAVDLKSRLAALLAGRGGADLVIALGTMAGKHVAAAAKENRLQIPVMVESVSDPVGSGIITSFADSGHELITASADPEAYDRQIRLFHQVVGFKKLGLIYTDTDTGRSYAALPVVQKAAADLGFAIIPNTDVLEDPPDPNDIPKAEDQYVAAVHKLGPQIDALYLTIQAGLTDASLPRVLKAAAEYKLPTFVMEGSNFVWKGALLGESNNLVTIEGLYSARKLTRILAGEKPRAQPQSNPHMSHIAVNLAAARQLGFDVPADILLSADDVYTNFMPTEGAAQ